MKYLKQFLIILLFSFLGEGLHELIPLQIPASIYGLVLLFFALLFGIVKLDHVKETANFLITIMPILFVPAGVGLLDNWEELQPILLPVMAIMIVSTVLVFGAAGGVTQIVMHKDKKGCEK